MTDKPPVKKSIPGTIIEQITGIFMPIISCLTAASILKSLLILLADFGVLDPASGTYLIFYAASDGFFYFLPIYLAITASRQWHTDLFISLLIPIAMLYPDITAVLENGGTLPLFGLTVRSCIYHSSVIPVLLSIGLLHYVEKLCDPIPDQIRGILKPIICCVIVLPVAFLVFGPLGGVIGDALTAVFGFLYDLNPVVAGAFMGFVIQPMVSVGAHWSIVPVSISAISTRGYDVIMPLLAGAVYGQCGAAFAMGLIYRDREKKKIAMQAALSCALGVTEPALFGVTLSCPRAMLSACVAGAVGGAIIGAAGTVCTSFAFPSYVTCVAFAQKGFVPFMLTMPFAFVLAFVLTMLQRKQLVDE